MRSCALLRILVALIIYCGVMFGVQGQTPPAGYNLTEIGLTGSDYVNITSSGKAYTSVAQQMNQAGYVRGYSYLRGHIGGGFGEDIWVFDGNSTIPIGLTGSGYDKTSSGPPTRSAVGQDMNEAGQVHGYTFRQSPTGAQLGRDSWFFNGTTTLLIGMVGTDYEYTRSTFGIWRTNEAVQMNNAGQVIGYSDRYSSTGTNQGKVAWLFNGTSTRLIGLNAESAVPNSAGATYSGSEVKQINEAGQVIGSSGRRSATGSGLGGDTWLFNGSTTQIIGLIGAGYEYTSGGGGTVRGSLVYHLNDAGQASGFSRPTTNLGFISNSQDAWFFNGINSQRIGLIGGVYQYTDSTGTARHSYPEQMNQAGHVRGYSFRYNASGNGLGQDTWFFDGISTQFIGLTGTSYEKPSTSLNGGTIRYNYAEEMNNAGHVRGYVERYNTAGETLGEDAWYFNGTTTQMIGLTGPGYEYAFTGTGGGTYRLSATAQMNEAGQVLGTTQRRNSAGDFLGRDAWLFSGTNTQLIGLTGSAYESSPTNTTVGGTYRNNNIQQLNEAGQVLGYTERVGSLGQSGWFYDPSTNVTTALEFSFLPDNYSYTAPALLTEEGVVLGSYRLYNGNTLVGDRAFWWSLDAGFYDLGSLVEGGLTAEGWQYLSSVYGSTVPGEISTTPGGSPLYILGTGRTVGQNAGISVYLLTPVPEPGTWALLGFIGLVFIGYLQRRRSTTLGRANRLIV